MELGYRSITGTLAESERIPEAAMRYFEAVFSEVQTRTSGVTAKRKVVTYRKQASRMASFGALRYDREPLTEVTAVALMRRGVHAPVMRLPQVHDTVRQGLITPQIAVAQAKEVSAYVGKGQNRWLLHRAKLWPSDRV